MTMTNDKSSFVASGCHVAIRDVATCCRARLPAGAGDVVLGVLLAYWGVSYS